MSREPYKVVAYEPGAARIVDRTTGEKVGYVLADFYRQWEPMRDGRGLGGPFRLRVDAARHVWETRP